MSKPPFIDFIRSDLSDWLVHCTKSFNELKKILQDEYLIGHSENIRGGHVCVCFSEAPLIEIKALIAFSKKYKHAVGDSIRYAPFGIAVRKKWLFEKGGRPVIYQADHEYTDLGDKQKFRHATYSPGSIDFTWEREWRIKCSQLNLAPENTMVFVETRENLNELLHDFYNCQCMSLGKSLAYGITIYPWGLIALDETS